MKNNILYVFLAFALFANISHASVSSLDSFRFLPRKECNGTIYYLHNDHLNTPQKATNASQAIVWDNITEAFGEPNALTGTLTNNLRFPGQLFDGEGTLNQNANRYYSYWHGRYTQPDPIGLSGGVNPYVYTGNNPVGRIDPSGLYDVNDFTIDSLQALAGFSDTVTLGGSSYARQALRTDYADTCSASYGSGEVAGYLTGGAGAVRAVFSKATQSTIHAAGSLTAKEAEEIQAIANRYNTQIDVVGSRAAGQGRNIETNLPVGKCPNTRSDIDFRISGQDEINTGGHISNSLKNVGNNAGEVLRDTGKSEPPVIIFRPKP